MKKSAKKWLIAAAFLVMLGAILFAAVMTSYHWDFSRLSTDRFETNTYEFREEFSDIKLNTETADILFAVSGDSTCKVVCNEEENLQHSVNVQNGTLTISLEDDRAWYEHIGFHFQSPKITVYLPQTDYSSLVIEESTGDIEITDKLNFESAGISLSTGNILIHDISAGSLDLSGSTGEIVIADVTCTGDLKACVTTGDVKVMNVTCQNFLASGSTSDIYLKNVLATERLSIDQSTGDVVFDSSDSAEIFVKTSTGDVRGSLLTEKVFVAETSTGSISVPRTVSGGRCKITTSTGNIDLYISDGSDE